MTRLKIISAFLLTLSLMVPLHLAQASQAILYNERIPFQDDFDSCSGERVLVTGIQHIVGRMVTDGAGRTHFNFTRNTHGTGLGYVSGARYILIDTVYQGSVETAGGAPQSLTQVYHSRMIRRGETAPHDDTLIHFLTKLTFNANGEVTTLIEIQDVTCQ